MGRTRRRKRSRERGPSAEKVEKIVQPLWKIPPYEIATEEQLALIHDKSMQILEEGGIAFYYEPALKILREHGVRVDEDQVAYFDRDLLMEYVKKAPSQFTWGARNPARNVEIGGNSVCFAPVAGPPYVHDVKRGRRDGTRQDQINFIKLAQAGKYIHTTGTETCAMTDVAIEHRHLYLVYDHFKYGDKPVMGQYGIGLMADDSVGMAEVVFGKERLEAGPVLHGIINVSSPRRLDDRMLSTAISFASRNQIIDVTPFILSGAMGPVSILGTVAQLNAEVLSGIAFLQMVREGAPAVYGSFQAILDLQSGAPVFGAPESQLALYLSGQLARYYDIPFRAAGAYASSKVADTQGGIEGVMSMFPSLMTRPNFVLHSAGWLESGLTAGYEKFVIDHEMLGMYIRYMQGVSWDDDEWAMDSIIRDVPPGGHHLGTQYTMDRFRTAFYRAELFDYDSAETWQANGGHETQARAYNKWNQMLNEEYEQPLLDPAIDEALLDYIERRKPELVPAMFA